MHVDAISAYATQTSRSAIEIRGDVLIQRSPEGVVVWDAATMKVRATHAFTSSSACLLLDGTLAVFAIPEKSDHCVVYRVDAANKVTTLFGPYYQGRGTILPSGRAGSYYVLQDRSMVVFDEEQGRIEDNDSIPYPDKAAIQTNLAYSLGDGRVVLGGSRLHVIARGSALQTYALGRVPRHIARMPNDRCWYSFESPGSNDRIGELALVAIAKPETDEQRVTRAREHIVHIASSPSGMLAMLVLALRTDAPSRDEAFRWSVVVIDATAQERWRTELPPSHTAGTDLELGSKGFIALSEQRVIVRGLRHQLFAWDVATGAPIPGTPTPASSR
jgi:hypothetical protein